MGRKPSITKQIAEALDTDDKRVQLERIGNLMTIAQLPAIAVTVLLSKGKVQLSVAGGERIGPEEVKQVLNLGVDEVTASVVRNQFEQNAKPQQEPPELPDDESPDTLANGDIDVGPP